MTHYTLLGHPGIIISLIVMALLVLMGILTVGALFWPMETFTIVLITIFALLLTRA